MSLPESARSGDRVAALRDLRDVLARQIDTCASPRDLAALSGRLQSVLSEIDELAPVEVVGDPLDELARIRAARLGPSADSARSAGAK